MSSFIRPAVVAACLALLPAVAFADTINVGDTVRFLGSNGTLGGGAFQVDDLGDGPGMDFLTFCLQRTQYLDYSSPFIVGGITDYADDDAGPDYLSAETRWIYKNFRAGTLPGYSADEIQAAIWKLENEWGNDVGNSAGLIAEAQAAVAGGASVDGVKVLNLFWANGTRAQDQLALTPVPEPATIALFGLGLLAVARWQRRNTAALEASKLPR